MPDRLALYPQEVRGADRAWPPRCACAPERAALYGRAGWEPIPGACLVGGTREAPFRSGDLGLVTLGMFLSPRAREHAADFAHADIVLELGRGQLW